MFPVYTDMNSYPHPKNQTPSPHFYYPNWEAFRPQMNENQANTSQTNEYWPPNYAYPIPTPCQSCCTQGQSPSYYNFRPPCPHYPLPPGPPPYGHFYGGYPAAYPQPYPYVPPYYSMEMPRYEYDKGLSKGFHCCECPNHPSHVKSTNNVKIEEHDPDEEPKKGESLVPARVSNSPYPVMWVPPEYMRNKELPRWVFESGKNEQPKSHHSEVREQGSEPVEKPNQSIQAVKQNPNDRSQWFPLDMNSIRKLIEGGDVMKPRDEEKKGGDEKKALELEKKDQNDKQFSYPIIWMPYNEQKEDHIRGQQEKNHGKMPIEDHEGSNTIKRPVGQHPLPFKVLKHPDHEPMKERSAGETTNGARKESIKPSNVRVIPVKQLDDSAPRISKKEGESKLNENLKDGEEHGNRGPVKNGTNNKPSAPTKKAKLPPICLRVDPPRKKNGKGSSSFPIAPAEKKSQEPGVPKEERKDKELRSSKEEIQVKEAVSHATNEEQNEACTRERQSEVKGKAVQEADSSKSDGIKCGSMHAPEPRPVKERNKQDASVRKILSREEAAVTIQSTYRGYVVRRWEPLKKLRQISNVRDEATKVKSQIEKLESVVAADNKEKVAIGEIIMNLLIKLDTVQGLHPSVREVRKSVANELIMLQEKLDSLVNEKSIPTSTCSNPDKEVEESPTAFSSDGDTAGSSVIIRDASEISEQGEVSNAQERVEAQRESEEERSAADPLSFGLASQDAMYSTENEASEVNEETGREAHSEEEVPALGASSENEGPVLCLEMNEEALDKTATSPNDPSMEFQDPLPNTSPCEGTRDSYQEAKLVAEAPLDFEQVDNEIYRMDWECDLGAAKITRGIDQEISKEIDDQVCGNVGSASEVEVVQEKHVQAESHGEINEDDQGETYELENSGTWNKKSAVDQPNDKPEVQCDYFVATEHEYNIMAGACGDSQRNIPITEQGGQFQEHTAEDILTVDHPNDKPEAQFDEVVDNEPENHVTAVTGDEEEQIAQEFEIADAPICAEKPIAELDYLLTKPIAEEEAPALKVEKEVISQETKCDEQPEEVTNGSESNLLTPSEGVKQECNTVSSTSLPEVQEYGDIPEASTSSPKGEQTERKITEENDKLRNMLEKLLASGKEQQDVISNLTAKVNDLEKKLSKQKKTRSGKRPGVMISRGKALIAR